MPTPEQLQSLRELVDTRAPILQIETHDEPRVLALFQQLAKGGDRQLWSWSAARGLRVLQGLKLKLDFGATAPPDSNDTKELPAALAQLQRMDGAWLVLLLDIHPYLSNPLITRALKELALRAGILRIQLARHRVGFDDAQLHALVAASEGFSGAEIEAAVVAARYEAHARTQPTTAELVQAELARTRPLSVTRGEAIDALRAWAAGRTVSAD